MLPTAGVLAKHRNCVFLHSMLVVLRWKRGWEMCQSYMLVVLCLKGFVAIISFFIGNAGWMLPDFDSMLFLRVSPLSLCANHTSPHTPHWSRIQFVTRPPFNFGFLYQGILQSNMEILDNKKRTVSDLRKGRTWDLWIHLICMRVHVFGTFHISPTFAMIFGSLYIFGASGQWLPLLACLVVWVKI